MAGESDEERALPERPGSHVLSTEAEKAFLVAVPNEWTAERVAQDYGVDFLLAVFADGRPTGQRVAVQLKATATGAADGGLLRLRVPTRTLNMLADLSDPALLVVYVRGEGLWHLAVGWYLQDNLERPAGVPEPQTTTVPIPTENTLNATSIRSAVESLFDNGDGDVARARQRTRVACRNRTGSSDRIARDSLLTVDDEVCLLECLPALGAGFAGDEEVIERLAALCTPGREALAISAFSALTRVSTERAAAVAEELLSERGRNPSTNAHAGVLTSFLVESSDEVADWLVEGIARAFLLSIDGVARASRLWGHLLQEALPKSPPSAREDILRRLQQTWGCLPHEKDPSAIIHHFMYEENHAFFGHEPDSG